VRDRGSASIWLLAVGFVVVSLGIGVALVGTAATHRHRAQVAADLGALAGARWAVLGAGTACDRAGRIVAANGGRLVACRLDGLDLVVTAGVGPALAVARAGPAAVPAPGEGVPPPSCPCDG
jgi:secretion/DNA translocation related TadE-like protein